MTPYIPGLTVGTSGDVCPFSGDLKAEPCGREVLIPHYGEQILLTKKAGD